MQVEVGPARADEIALFYAGRETNYEMLTVDGAIIAMAGFVRKDGRTWAFLDVSTEHIVPRLVLVRSIIRRMRARGGLIYVSCDAAKFPNAPKLLRVLGFRPTLEMASDGQMRVWEWQS